MALVTMDRLMERAGQKNGAVGAFNVGNMEMVMGVVQAAQELKEPVILQIAQKRLGHSPLELIGPMMVAAARSAAVDIAVNLDHGLTPECAGQALELGFTSVMFDGSSLPFEENIEATRRVKELASGYGAVVEAELGVVGGNEGGGEKQIRCTEPETAGEFCERTGVDALAVAIGNAHGVYTALPELRFDILEQIRSRTKIPLVLHGGTGMTPEMFRRAIDGGIRKINIATSGLQSMAEYARNYCNSVTKADYFKLSESMVQGVYENTLAHIRLFAGQ